MNLFRKLFAIEWIKLRRRSVFWVVTGAHVVMLAIALGAQQYMHAIKPASSPFRLPEDWMELIQIGSQVGMLMLIIGVTLLTASEAAWRTQRQNVIDGLSRAEYFSGKILVVMLLVLILWVDIIVPGLIIAPFGGTGAFTWPVFSPLALDMLPNVMLYLVGMGITAFMFGMVAPTSGAALGLMFAFIMVQPIISGIMMSRGGYLSKMSRYLPIDVFNNLVSPGSYEPARFAQMNEVIVKSGMPGLLSLRTSEVVAVLYVLAFIGVTWLSFRKRDL